MTLTYSSIRGLALLLGETFQSLPSMTVCTLHLGALGASAWDAAYFPCGTGTTLTVDSTADGSMLLAAERTRRHPLVAEVALELFWKVNAE